MPEVMLEGRCGRKNTANVICTFAEEEKLLIEFFGRDYEEYRSHTRVGIPFTS